MTSPLQAAAEAHPLDTLALEAAADAVMTLRHKRSRFSPKRRTPADCEMALVVVRAYLDALPPLPVYRMEVKP